MLGDLRRLVSDRILILRECRPAGVRFVGVCASSVVLGHGLLRRRYEYIRDGPGRSVWYVMGAGRERGCQARRHNKCYMGASRDRGLQALIYGIYLYLLAIVPQIDRHGFSGSRAENKHASRLFYSIKSSNNLLDLWQPNSLQFTEYRGT